MKKYGSTNEAINETIRICKDEDVLKTYLTAHEQEAISIMMALFNEAYIQDAYGYEKKMEGKREGKIEGRIEGKIEGRIEGKMEGELGERIRIIRSMKAKNRSDDEIADMLTISVKEVISALAQGN